MQVKVEVSSRPSRGGSEKLHWVLAWTAVGLTALLIVTHWTFNGLWIDEIYTLHSISLPWREMVLERLQRGHFPIYFLLMKLWISLCGAVSETALRAPSLFFWLSSSIAYALVIRRYASGFAAPIAFLFFALNGLAVRQATEARMYDLVLLESVWLFAAFMEMLRGNTSRFARLSLIFVPLLMFFTSASAMLVLVGLLFEAFYQRRRNRALLQCLLWACGLIVLSAILPVTVHVSTRDRTEIAHIPPAALFLHLITFVSGITGYDDYYRLGTAQWLFITIGTLVTCITLFYAFQAQGSTYDVSKTALRVALFPWFLMLVTWIMEEIVRISVALHGPARYLIGILPFSALLPASALEQIAQNDRRRAIIFALVLGVLFVNAFFTVRMRLETPRELLTQYLRPRYQKDDVVLLVPDQAREAVNLYAPEISLAEVFPRSLKDTQTLASILGKYADKQRVWLIWIHGKGSPVIDVADGVFGKGISSSPARPRGERRIFLYTPTQKQEK